MPELPLSQRARNAQAAINATVGAKRGLPRPTATPVPEVSSEFSSLSEFESFVDGIRTRRELNHHELIARGFDVEAGVLNYQGVPIAPESLLAQTPHPHIAAEDAKNFRASLRPGYLQAWSRWLAASLRLGNYAANPSDGGLEVLSPAERNALAGGAASTGGFTIPQEVSAAMIRGRAATSTMRRAGARVVPAASNSLRLPRGTAHSSGSGTFSSSFSVGWQPEVPTSSTSIFNDTAAIETVDVAIRKLLAGLVASNDLLDDEGAGLLEFIGSEGGAAVGAAEDAAFWSGLGYAGEPLGVLGQATATVDIEGSTTDQITSTTASAGSIPKVIDLQSGLPGQYAADAAWFARGTTAARLRKLVMASGDYWWRADQRQFLGADVVLTDAIPADGTNANRCLVYGSPAGGVVIVERLGFSLNIARGLYANSDQAGIVIRSRVGIALLHPASLRIGIV